QPGQSIGEGDQAGELGLVAAGQPLGMVAVLLAPALVAACGLDMAVGRRADPDILPGRRYGKAPDALARLLVPHLRPVRRDIAEALAGPTAANARLAVADIGESRATGCRQRVVGGKDGGVGTLQLEFHSRWPG